MNKTILITGSSTGIGRATALKFQKEGWNVIATMRTPEKEEKLTKLDQVLVTKLDVQDVETIKSAFAEGLEKFGKIDVVLNNAGYGLMGTFESADDASIRRQFDVNVFGLFDVTKAALPHFRANKSGLFINISSIGGKMTFPLMPLYHSTKFAVEGFSESLHYELAAAGIKVKLVEPGGVATDFGSRSLDYRHDESLEEYNEYAKSAFENMMSSFKPEDMSKPELIADIIFEAATDGKDTLRYRAGADAEQLLTARASMNDEEFIGMMKTNLGV
ncbi:MAG: SDR family oxidoreductase [Ekhidna sp.]|nr:SDR family oxidoreductase [Ekhidna sp.]